MTPISTISVYSDVICPWCLVGKKRLERALYALDLTGRIAIEWLPYELNPDMPPEGMERSAYRARKFGPERGAELDAQMTDLGRQEGIAFAFDRITRTPNTRRAHMLIAHASRLGLGPAMKAALLSAYFERARDVGDPEVLVDEAARTGIGRDNVLAAIADEGLRDFVIDAERDAAARGIAGVPFFIVDGAYGVSGAQPADVWIEALRRILPADSAADRPRAVREASP